MNPTTLLRLSLLSIALTSVSTSPIAAKTAEQGIVIAQIEFGGGRCGDFFELLRGAIPQGKAVNFVLDEGVAGFHLPAIALRSVQVYEAIEIAMSTAAARKQKMRALWRDNICLITAQTSRKKPEASPKRDGKPELRAFRIDPDTSRPLLEALDAALTLHTEHFGHDEAVIRFHQDSGLLIIVANAEQLELTEHVIHALGGEREHERYEHEAHEHEEREREELEHEREALERALELLHQRGEHGEHHEHESDDDEDHEHEHEPKENALRHMKRELESLHRRNVELDRKRVRDHARREHADQQIHDRVRQYERAYQMQRALQERKEEFEELRVQLHKLEEQVDRLRQQEKRLQAVVQDQRALIQQLRNSQAAKNESP